MKKIVAVFLCGIGLASIPGCSGAYAKAEEATKEMIGVMDDISTALESVKDKASAKAAAPKISAGVDRMRDVTKRLEAIKGTKADEEKLNKEWLPKVKKAAERMQTAGLTAGLKSEGEPTFLEAVEKMKHLK
jgi:hypothetical protein